MLAEKLKELRTQKNVTQDYMANLLNIKRQTYSAYERGISLPDAIAIMKLADFFCVSTDYLLGYNNPTVKKPAFSDKLQPLIGLCSDLNESELENVIAYIDFLKSKRTKN